MGPGLEPFLVAKSFENIAGEITVESLLVSCGINNRFYVAGTSARF
jgi:hypothetical protein